ncbi:GFA family protein [Octadecabacter sp. CECT 8868]|uniref:GFA family protein n=1 Tax=Octadecabacter algicola TaxID=2909342 RepID=UPI001F35BF64|nr:GFA family protein [Octadecabacter algicola]MCF2906571.1 GFA family protein [Octadecabacter algicola]
MTEQRNIGRCYCGACSISTSADPSTVLYCHCSDCRRWTGAALPAFVAFATDDVAVTPNVNSARYESGAVRQNCPDCGSPLTAAFPYLPDQIYVPVGVLNNPDHYPPQLHCHVASKPKWLHIEDDLARVTASGRDTLNEAFDD